MNRFALPLVLVVVLVTHLVMAEPTEPFYNGDETRHVMTGIFVADAITDGGLTHPRSYAERYYAQYPALGLIVWPPGFYAVEGVTMLAFGRSFETSRWLTVAYCLLACTFCFRLVKFTHHEATAVVATLVFAFSREVFFHSRNVMLEVPTTAFVLMAMFFLERFLHHERRRDLVYVALACILAGLHRYDAVLLLPYFTFRILFARRWDLLKRRSVWIAAASVILALAPVNLLALVETGTVQSNGGDPTSSPGTRFDHYTLFFATLWGQLGHVAHVFSLAGFFLCLRASRRAANGPYWSIALATYLFFAPMAEQESRHAIFWIVSWSVWAAEAALMTGQNWISAILSAILVTSTAYWTLHQPVPWVRGYSTAAELAIKEINGSGMVLFNGHLSGTIVYELRTLDADRRLWLVRTDKVFYSAVSDPSQGYVEWTKTDAEILKKLEALAPDMVIVEEPRARTDTPMAKRFREIMKTHGDYVHAAVIPVRSNGIAWMENVQLIVYLPRIPKPPDERKLNIPMIWQGTSIDAVIPKK